MSVSRRPPDFFLIGAPKAGTSALHAALAQHPGLFLSPVKEPKYYMCGDSPPPAYKGPGDAHSNQEWIWQRERYLGLFDDAPDGVLRGREHAVLPLQPRRPAPDRRGRARGEADRGAPRPGRPRLLQLDAPLDGRARAARRRRRGGAPRARARRQGLGAVLALPGTGDVRPPGRRPARPLRPGAGAAAALPRARRRAVGHPRPGVPLPRRAVGGRGHHPEGQRPGVRPGRPPRAGDRAGDPGGCRGRRSSCPPRCGAGSASR